MFVNNIGTYVMNNYQKYKSYFLPTCLVVAFSLVLAYVLNLFFSGLFILVIFFLVIPLLGCMIINNVQYSGGKEYSLKDFYKGYRITLLPGLHGSFRMIKSFIYASLIMIGCFSLIYEVTSIFTSVIDPELINLLKAAKDNNEIYSIFEAYLQDPSSDYYMYLYSIFYLVSFGIALFFFIHFVLRSTPLFYIQTNMGCSKKDAIFLYKKVYPTYKKSLNMTFSKIGWAYYLVYPFSFAIGAFIGWALFKNVTLAILIAMLISLLCSSPFLAIYLLTQDCFFRLNTSTYKIEAKFLFEKALQNVEHDTRISEDQKEIIKKFYSEQLIEIEKLEELKSLLDKQMETDNSKNDDQNNEKQ